jgi:ornithine decarboxylase
LFVIAARQQGAAVMSPLSVWGEDRAMAKVRFAAAARAAATLPTVDAVVARLRPDEPLLCLRPSTVASASRQFVAAFPGDVLYAVKCNPEPRVLRAVSAGGVRHFDCASLAEIALVRRVLPGAEVHFMHPVKSRGAIRRAFHEFGVTDFAFDSVDELAKIVQETVSLGLVGAPATLGLFVRLAVKQGGAYDLSGKFGVGGDAAAALLRAARPHAARLGVAFHVGSQCLDPAAYVRAIDLAAEAIARSGVAVEIVDVGGGFPVSYPDSVPPPIGDYVAAIAEAAGHLGDGVRLWAEPGRALVAGGASVVAQVQLRRDRALYINDGVYGSLSDAGHPGFRFPCRRLGSEASMTDDAALVTFELFGPTCDSADHMRGPFLLPADMREGEWIELGQLGAYGACLRTRFNGFDGGELVEVADPPMLATPGY